ncbi:isochorismatase family hydrolase [Exophiala viscosa]|uniref:isochorismatase family hydrolase n=1 Tax=Exophiala viscosa TaxID=2486360 RepID=UPI0021944EDF|nr:isochorismatase family hydrolase [Exophiala viscosa]
MSFKPALIVVDMQNDFCPPDGSLAISGGKDIVPLINRLVASPVFVLKIATQDWHPQDHVSFATNHPAPNNKPYKSFIDVENIVGNKPEQTMKQRLWPVHCVQHTKGADIIGEIDQSKIDIIVKKGMDSRVEMYSAFTDSFGNLTAGSGGVNIDLGEALKTQQITHCFVVGLAGDYCVKDTALGSARAGFVTYLVEDAQKCGNPEGWSEVKAELLKGSVAVINSASEEARRVLEG